MLLELLLAGHSGMSQGFEEMQIMQVACWTFRHVVGGREKSRCC